MIILTYAVPKWKHIQHHQLPFIKFQQKPLSEALKFVDSHICKREPTEVAQFNLQSPSTSELFRGVMDVTVSIEETTGSSHSSTLREVLELKDDTLSIHTAAESQGTIFFVGFSLN